MEIEGSTQKLVLTQACMVASCDMLDAKSGSKYYKVGILSPNGVIKLCANQKSGQKIAETIKRKKDCCFKFEYTFTRRGKEDRYLEALGITDVLRVVE